MSKKQNLIPSVISTVNTEPRTLKSTFRASGHLIDAKLKYSYPKENDLAIPDFGTAKVIKDIESITREETVAGIDLAPVDDNLVMAICRLLDEKSQTFDSSKRNYYSGNIEKLVAVKYFNEEAIVPSLSITLYELAKACKEDNGKVSGRDEQRVEERIKKLANRKFRLRYTETTIAKNGDQLVRFYDKERPLILLDTAREEFTKKDGTDSYSVSKLIITLHPIFKREIEKKYIVFPKDIYTRIKNIYKEISGKKRVKIGSVIIKLTDFLLRAKSNLKNGNFRTEIKLERLYYQLAEKYMKENRRQKVKEEVTIALEIMLKLNLLKDYKIICNKKGESKFCYEVNKDFK